MTEKSFLNNLANGKTDILQLLLDKLSGLKIDYCVVGGLAVNTYAEPVASLDLDIVLAINDVEKFINNVQEIFAINKFKHCINLNHKDSDLRIQIQTDSRYQSFIDRSTEKMVLGYKMKVALLEDILNGKIWAYLDQEKRKSKRQKDLADIMWLIEIHTHLYHSLPDNIRTLI